MGKSKDFCEIKSRSDYIELEGSNPQQFESTRNLIEKFLELNILKDCTEPIEDPAVKTIMMKYCEEDIKKVFQDFRICPTKNIGYPNQLKYQIPSFYKNDCEKLLREKIAQIEKDIIRQPVYCSRHQFEILQKFDKKVLNQIQNDLGVQIVSDVNKLNELGYQVKYLQVNPNDYKKCFVYSSSSPSLQVLLINGNIKNIELDCLMINANIKGEYLDDYSPNFVEQGSCRFAIQDINKLQYSHLSEQERNSRRFEQKLKNFNYFQTFKQDTNPVHKDIAMAILNADYSNINYLLTKFFEKYQDYLNLGIVIPNEKYLQIDYIENIRKILKNQFSQENNSQSVKPKNLYIFCAKPQINHIVDLFQQKMDDGIVLYKSQNKNLILNNYQQYEIENYETPFEFNQLLYYFYSMNKQSEKRFYAFLPHNDKQNLISIKILLQPSKDQPPTIFFQNEIYDLESYLDVFDNEIRKDILKAVDNGKEQKLESIYIYVDEEQNFCCDLVRVSLNNHKVKFIKQNKSLDIKEKQCDKDEKKDYVYVISGYQQNDITQAQDKINNQIFKNHERILWDYNHYKDEPLFVNVINDKNNTTLAQIYQKYATIFNQQQFELIKLQFIQNNSLAQNYQDELMKIHQKCQGSPIIYNDMFYINKDINLSEIYSCKETGFDVRIHNSSKSQINQYSIQLQNKLFLEQGLEQQDCLICEVIGGNSIQYSEDMFDHKRLPKDNNDQFYHSLKKEIGKDSFQIGIFDNHRIYPAFLATYKKLDSETQQSDMSFSKKQ